MLKLCRQCHQSCFRSKLLWHVIFSRIFCVFVPLGIIPARGLIARRRLLIFALVFFSSYAVHSALFLTPDIRCGPLFFLYILSYGRTDGTRVGYSDGSTR